MAQVSATPLPLPRHPDPKASGMKRPCWQALRHFLGLLCPGKACWGFRQLVCTGPGKE